MSYGDPISITEIELERAVQVLRDGGLVAFPTETVYGLGADARNEHAVAAIFKAKGRPTTHPLIVHLPSHDSLDEWVTHVPDGARRCASALWPGPLTLVLDRASHVSDTVTGGLSTVALRVPNHSIALSLLRRFGGGVVAPSANRFGQVSPTTAADVQEELGDAVSVILDGGPCEVGVESTVLDFSGDVVTVLRPGGVTLDRLEAILGQRPTVWQGEGPARAPGMLASHYAPRARVELTDRSDLHVRAHELLEQGQRVAVLASEPIEGLDPRLIALAPAGDPDSYARVLYARLREADARKAHTLLVLPPPEEGIGVAIRDRLTRAANAR